MSESILNENLIATFEQSLRQTRNAQNRLMVRLREVETEGDRLREEIEALDNSAEKTEAAIYSILATMGSKRKGGNKNPRKESHNNGNESSNEGRNNNQRSERDFEDYSTSSYRPANTFDWRNDDALEALNRQNRHNSNSDYDSNPIAYLNKNRGYDRNNNDEDRGNRGNQYRQDNRNLPTVGHNIEPISERFSERTITQACTLLLREVGKPLHVNELYNHLVAGGFTFKGNNPTISIAVSLNRNRRFRKVAPGTFDLVMRDASKAAS
jgi:hypothetical protein